MAIVFFGTPEFAIPSLELLFKERENIVLVVTQPDKKAGRGHKLKPPPVKLKAIEFGIKVSQPQYIKNNEFIKNIASLNPEFIIVVAYGKILPKELLSITKCINLHASLLPKYRGAAPVQWALINGETKTGVTTMLMDEGLDTGDILLQKEVQIQEDDNTFTLSKRLSKLGAEILFKTLKGIRDGSIKPFSQIGKPSYAPILQKSDGLIDWNLSAQQIHNRVRGLYPWPCAYTYIKGNMIKIIATKVIKGQGKPAVIVKKSRSELVVGTSNGLLSILQLQPEGKKFMSIQAFLQGAGREISEGDKFE